MFDGKAFGAEMVSVVKTYMEQNVAPLLARIDSLEKTIAALPEPKDGSPGKSVTPEEMAPLVTAEVAKAIAAIPPARDGQDGRTITVDDVRPLIAETVGKAVAELPTAKDGKDGKDGVDGSNGKDGESFTLSDAQELIDDAVSKSMSALPVAKDGKDGAGIAGALIDRNGSLILTLSDGTTKELGLVIGKDGEPGKPGTDGKDGEPGKDGRDGFGFDDIAFETRDDGSYLKFAKAENVVAFRLPIPRDCGVFKDGADYFAGDCVTWGGSLWIAQDATKDKPDTGKGWRLAVKRGRDGKDGVMKPAPKPAIVSVAR